MKRKLIAALIALVLLAVLGALVTARNERRGEQYSAKPVVNLYPEAETLVRVRLDYGGRLTCTYPAYGADGWEVLAFPDGTLVDPETGAEYSYLFWEGVDRVEYDLSEGFVVPGGETADFLRRTLSGLGLIPREYNEFIVYWLPKMQDNPYNLITFQTDAYTDNAVLTVDPEPDSVLRVFMVWQALEEPVEVKEPELEGFVREGFTLVEWGGCEYEGGT